MIPTQLQTLQTLQTLPKDLHLPTQLLADTTEYSWSDVIIQPFPPHRGFRLGRILESNTTFTVYNAAHDFYGTCVVKVYTPEFAFVADYELAFLRYLRSHANIVTVHDTWVHHTTRYIAMEKMDGTLNDLIVSGMSHDHIHDAVRQIAVGLHYIHKKNIIHFDIKPNNIGYTQRPDGTRVYKLTEFGLAEWSRVTSSTEFQCDIANGCFEKTAQVYRSYELLLLSDEPISEKADVWSFGCIVYEMVFGTPLFKKLNTTDDRYEHKKIIQDAWLHIRRMQHNSSDIVQLAHLVLECTNPFVAKRLSMNDVMKRIR